MRTPSSRPTWLLVLALGSGSAAAQNLFVNPGFATNLAGWTVESGVSAGWSPLDIGGSAASGSALVTNSSGVAGFSGGLQQCVAVVPAARSVLSTSPSPQTAMLGMMASITAGACSGGDSRKAWEVMTTPM